MDITKFKGIGSQLVMYKGIKSPAIKYKVDERPYERYYWRVDKFLPINEDLNPRYTYIFTGYAGTYNGNSIFGLPDRTDSNDFRIFWQGLPKQFFFDSGSGRIQRNDFATYSDFLTYVLRFQSLDINKNQQRVYRETISPYRSTGSNLGFCSWGNEVFNVYEFKVQDFFTNEIIKHYIPLKDGHTFYDVISGQLVDTGQTFQVFDSDKIVNNLGEDIPGYRY